MQTVTFLLLPSSNRELIGVSNRADRALTIWPFTNSVIHVRQNSPLQPFLLRCTL